MEAGRGERTYPTEMKRAPLSMIPLLGRYPVKTSTHTGLTLTRMATNDPRTAITRSPMANSKTRIERVTTVVGSTSSRQFLFDGEKEGHTLVEEEEDQEDVRRGEEYGGVHWNDGEEQVDRDGGSEQLCEVGTDDGTLGDDIEGVEHSPAVEHLVSRTVVQSESTVLGQVCVQESLGHTRSTNRRGLDSPRPVTVPSRVDKTWKRSAINPERRMMKR